MYRLSSSSLPSSRTWDQLNGDTLAGKSSHRKVNLINRVRGHWIDYFIGWQNSFGHPDQARKLKNHIVSLQRKIIFHIQLNPYSMKSQTIHSKLAGKLFETSECHQEAWNRDLKLGLVSAYIPGNAMSNLEPWRLYKALHDDLILPSAKAVSNICRRDYAMTVDAIKKQLPLLNKVSLSLDRLTSRNKLAISSVIAHYMNQNWALREVQPAVNEVHRLICSHFKS